MEDSVTFILIDLDYVQVNRNVELIYGICSNLFLVLISYIFIEIFLKITKY